MICALCRQDRKLVRSHIIPEFLYEPAYDHLHRVIQVSRGDPDRRFHQKGLRQRLLCAACEHLLNARYEQPMSRAWPTLIPRNVAGKQLSIQAQDRSVFELFHLSIIWRANVATAPEWSDVSLGNRHAEIIRTALLTGHLAGADYPIFANVFLEGRSPCFGWVGPSTVGRLGAGRVYSTLYGGCMWTVLVASHAQIHPSNPFRLSASGRLIAPVWPIEQMPRLNLAPLLTFKVE